MTSKPRPASTSYLAGRNPVREALEQKGDEIEKVLIQKGAGGRPVQEIRRLASESGVPVQYVPEAKLAQLVPGVNHQGVVAVASPIPYLEVEEMLSQIAPTLDDVRSRKPFVLVLDRIQDPHNFGAILRSSVAAGVDGVVVPKHGMAPLNAAAVKASAGTAARIPIARADNLARLLHQLKERGYWVAGTTGSGETSIWEMDWDRPLALVIGSEGEGMRPGVASECDYLLSIPMRGEAESLNASVATGIVLFVAMRHRAV